MFISIAIDKATVAPAEYSINVTLSIYYSRAQHFIHYIIDLSSLFIAFGVGHIQLLRSTLKNNTILFCSPFFLTFFLFLDFNNETQLRKFR